MTYKRFEDLPVWQEAIRLAEGVDDFTRSLERGVLTFSQRDQIERAAVSVSNNIAEGFERGTKNELLMFLYIARGSAGEVRSMLCLFEKRPYLKDFKSQISKLKKIAESCSRQLAGWANQLKDSDIKGQRHLDKNARLAHDNKQRRKAFLRELNESLPDGHPMKRDQNSE